MSEIIDSIKAKFGETSIKSMDVFKEFGNPGYNALLKHGTKVKHGTYTLVKVEKTEPAAKVAVKTPVPASKIPQRPVRNWRVAWLDKYSSLVFARTYFESQGLETLQRGETYFVNDAGTFHYVDDQLQVRLFGCLGAVAATKDLMEKTFG